MFTKWPSLFLIVCSVCYATGVAALDVPKLTDPSWAKSSPEPAVLGEIVDLMETHPSDVKLSCTANTVCAPHMECSSKSKLDVEFRTYLFRDQTIVSRRIRDPKEGSVRESVFIDIAGDGFVDGSDLEIIRPSGAPKLSIPEAQRYVAAVKEAREALPTTLQEPYRSLVFDMLRCLKQKYKIKD